MKIARPASLDAALALIEAGAGPVAGGTGWQLAWSQGQPRPAQLVAVGHLLPDKIDGLTLGAGASVQDIRHAGLPLLSQAARDVAAQNIRQLGTLGGNIAMGNGCLLPALLALDAVLDTTAGPCPLSDWLAAPTGLILRVTLRPGQHHVWRKTGLRAAFTPAIINAAGTLELDGDRIVAARLAVGGGTVPPQRLPEVEGWLAGQDRSAIDGAALRQRIEAAVDAPDCAFRSARYRRRVAAAALGFGLAGDLPRPAAGTVPKAPVAAPHGQPLTELDRQAGAARWHTRPDMPAKVRGRAGYLTDARAPDMLVGRILRAAHPHARIRAIDTSAARALDGVRAVVTHADIPGQNGFGIIFQDQPALCADKVRYTGDAVAAVAAVDAPTAERALALIQVEYDPLPVVGDAAAALAADAPPVHAGGNLVSEVGLERGDLAEGWARAVHVVEDTYVTPRQMHGFMETEGGWAAPTTDGIAVHVGGQHGARDQAQLARILALPEAAIRVVTSPTGGGFGGKDELTVQPALALLALATGAPVRLHLSREESVAAGTKRNPMRIRMRTGCDAAGRLVAQEVDVLADCGAYASLSPTVLETGMEHAAGPYEVANIRTHGRLAYTNNGTGGAFRGFGANQMAFAVECQMDRLAALCGLDPVTIRQRNLRVPGSPGYLGQRVAPSERMEELLEVARASEIWAAPDAGRPDEVIGSGMALNYQGNGLGTIPHDEAGFALALRDGRIEARCGLDEMGQGLEASLHATVADSLGCGRGDVRAVVGDTARAPDSGSTSASRGGYVVWRGVGETAPAFRTALLARAADRLGRPAEDLCVVPGGIGAARANAPKALIAFDALGDIDPVACNFGFPKTEYSAGNARYIFAYAVTLTRVAVSRVTGDVRLLDLQMHTAAGPVLDLASYLGQIEGGMVQGLGFTLTEDMVFAAGRPVTANLDGYMLPSLRDAPDRMRVTALETLDPGDPYGARGIGELGIGAVTPAIANAVAAATGRWPAVTPFPPELVLDLIEGGRG